MTIDTTDQQAVTVALQTAFYLLDTLAGEGLSQTCPDGRTIEADETVQALCSASYMEPTDDWHSDLAARLASVSSTSADWTRTKAFDEAAAECMRAAEAGTFADTVSEDERNGHRSACNLLAMNFRLMASRAAPEWLTPEPVPATNQAGEVERQAITAAIGKADDAFGYSYRMTSLVDDVATHTLFMDGFEPVSFEDRDDGVRLIAERRNQLRADAVLAALATQPATSQEGEQLREALQFAEHLRSKPWSEVGHLAPNLDRFYAAFPTDTPASSQYGEAVALDAYDTGLLGDGGGGDVDWWQNYIRHELERAHEFYSDQFANVAPPLPVIHEATASIVARTVRQTLRDYGHGTAESSLPEAIASDVAAALAEVPTTPVMDDLSDALYALRRHLNLVGYAINDRNWRDTESVYNAHRDNLDGILIKRRLTALATQPATSQEGNESEIPTSSLAATPTPPTLSEDLRAALERAQSKLGHVSVDAMNGDNLAVTLCTHFDDGEGDEDENGWTPAASDGCDSTLKAIHAVYVAGLAQVKAS